MNRRESYWVLGHHVTPLPTIGDYGLVEIVSPPDVPGPPPHHHADAAEFFYIADGRLDVQLDGTWRTLEAGESVCIPPGTVHTLRNTGREDCRWITGWSPRGFEEFFTRFGVRTDRVDARQESTSEAAVGRVVSGCADLGMIIAAP